MNKITRAHIRGFRRLHDVDLEMRSLMVLIGANGVGKTTFLDVFALLSASAAGNLSKRMAELGGLDSIVTRNGTKELSLHVDMEVPGHQPLQYDLGLQVAGIGHNISREALYQKRPVSGSPFKHIDSTLDNIRYFNPDNKKLLRPNWDHNPRETSLAQVPKMFRQPEELRNILSSASHYHTLDVTSNAPVKVPQKMRPATLPGSNGEDLVSLLYYLREQHKDRFETIVDTLHVAFRGFDWLSFPPVAAGTLTMLWKDRSFSEPIYIHELSEGTLRFLWLVTLLQSPGLPTVTMIDEPEVSLHPEQLSLLADLFREASRRTQLIVATHSDRLVRFLEPGEVVAMDIDEESGLTSATWADTLELESWLEEYSMDEVWQMGRMGARA